MESKQRTFRYKVLTGQVVATRAKTIVVKIRRIYRIPKYGKLKTWYKKCHAHDEQNVAKVGDIVSIRSSRPRSALKRWILISPRGRDSSFK